MEFHFRQFVLNYDRVFGIETIDLLRKIARKYLLYFVIKNNGWREEKK